MIIITILIKIMITIVMIIITTIEMMMTNSWLMPIDSDTFKVIPPKVDRGP